MKVDILAATILMIVSAGIPFYVAGIAVSRL